jgi:hypothetical protein
MGAMDEAAMGLPAGEFEVWIGDYAMPVYAGRRGPGSPDRPRDLGDRGRA